MKKALTIAGFDPSGGAGIQADLKVFHSLGVYGLSAVSSLTVQNTRGVSSILPVSENFLKKQLMVLLSDLKPDAAKTGMLYSEYKVEIVAYSIKKYSLKNIVVDPVIVSSTGKKLAKKGMLAAVKKRLLPLCTVVTPNMYEASVLTGINIKNISDMKKAAVYLKDYGADTVVITGGHLEKDPTDIVFDGKFHFLKDRRIKGEYHGTGCMFSAALTAFLALEYPVLEAVKMAKGFMKKAFNKSFDTGKGLKLFDLK